MFRVRALRAVTSTPLPARTSHARRFVAAPPAGGSPLPKLGGAGASGVSGGFQGGLLALILAGAIGAGVYYRDTIAGDAKQADTTKQEAQPNPSSKKGDTDAIAKSPPKKPPVEKDGGTDDKKEVDTARKNKVIAVPAAGKPAEETGRQNRLDELAKFQPEEDLSTVKATVNPKPQIETLSAEKEKQTSPSASSVTTSSDPASSPSTSSPPSSPSSASDPSSDSTISSDSDSPRSGQPAATDEAIPTQAPLIEDAVIDKALEDAKAQIQGTTERLADPKVAGKFAHAAKGSLEDIFANLAFELRELSKQVEQKSHSEFEDELQRLHEYHTTAAAMMPAVEQQVHIKQLEEHMQLLRAQYRHAVARAINGAEQKAKELLQQQQKQQQRVTEAELQKQQQHLHDQFLEDMNDTLLVVSDLEKKQFVRQLDQELSKQHGALLEEAQVMYTQQHKLLTEEFESERNKRLEHLESLSTRLQALEKVFEQQLHLESDSIQVHRLARAVVALERAADSSGSGSGVPFYSAWNQLKTAAHADGLLSAALTAISDEQIQRGVPTLESIQQQWQAAERACRTVAFIPNGDTGSMWGQIVGSTFAVLTIPERKLVEGTDNHARLSRASYFLQNGDLSRGVHEVESFSPGMLDACQPWLASARQRVLVENALDLARARVLVLSGSMT